MYSLIVALGILVAGVAMAKEELKVHVLGTLHNLQLQKKSGYSFKDLLSQIVALKPDLVCGEITPQHHNTLYAATHYPIEIPIVEYAAKKTNAKFLASDWRLPLEAEYIVTEAEKLMTDQEKKLFANAYEEFMPKFKAAFGDKMFEFVHDEANYPLAKKPHDLYIQAGSEIVSGFWETRNQMIVKNCMREAEKLKSKNVVIVYGMEHKYSIEHYLDKFYALKAQKISRMFVHSDDELPTEIVDTWKKMLSDIEKSKNDPTVSAAMKDYIKNSPMPKIFQQAIEQKGAAK